MSACKNKKRFQMWFPFICGIAELLNYLVEKYFRKVSLVCKDSFKKYRKDRG